MSLLRDEPPEPLRSIGEFFALAQALEEEAATQYAELAGQMRALDLPKVAAVFEHLAAEERGHAGKVEGWARSETGAAPDPARLRWQPPETFGREDAGAMASSRLASAYRALSMAVRNEERAFALWTYIAAQADDPAIQAAAERMAAEELRHAAMLRQERRRAFHDERATSSAPRLPPEARAAEAERGLAATLAALAEAEQAARHAEEFRRLATEAATRSGMPARPPPPGAQPAPDGPARALGLAEQAIEAYLDAAEAAQDEAELHRLQSLAEQAIARAALLRRIAAAG